MSIFSTLRAASLEEPRVFALALSIPLTGWDRAARASRLERRAGWRHV